MTPSKGKRSKKRKRKELAEAKTSNAVKPPIPEISSFVRIGLNAVARDLEALARVSRPTRTDEVDGPRMLEEAAVLKDPRNDNGSANSSTSFSAIFVLPSTEPAILHTQLPQLIATATAANPDAPSIRLVQLPKGSSSRLSDALALPRVSFIGLVNAAPNSQALVDFIREHVPEVHVPWLQEVQTPVYLPVKINAIDTFATIAKKVSKTA